jgi:aldose 1-epimerase
MPSAEREGFEVFVLGSRAGAIQATFVPAAGMVCCSLRYQGAEMLVQRDGVRAYAERGSTMGIPLLYPWANRLAGLRYQGAHGEVTLARDDPLLRFDGNGLPIHGALAGRLPWELVEHDGSRLRARLPWRRSDLLAIFPFAHVLELEARVSDATLAVETTVSACEGVAVPVSFGYHPYLSIPDSDRASWHVQLPVSRRLRLDERMIPTGASAPLQERSFALADGGWDDAFTGLLDPPVFTLSGGRRGVELTLREGYSYAQLYAPAAASFACFEPMTAPTNALVSREQLPIARVGEEYRAAFAVSVADGECGGFRTPMARSPNWSDFR